MASPLMLDAVGEVLIISERAARPTRLARCLNNFFSETAEVRSQDFGELKYSGADQHAYGLD
jgi:hypothetical protein